MTTQTGRMSVDPRSAGASWSFSEDQSAIDRL
jgi:hypothetical protein